MALAILPLTAGRPIIENHYKSKISAVFTFLFYRTRACEQHIGWNNNDLFDIIIYKMYCQYFNLMI